MFAVVSASALQRARLRGRLRVVGDLIDVLRAHPVRRLRRGDVPLDVRLLDAALARVHVEVPHRPREDRADDHRRRDEQAGGDQRQAPAADERGDDEQDRDQQGDHGEDQPAGDDRVRVGVRGTGQQAARARVVERHVLVEEQAHGLQDQEHREGDRDLHARGAGDAHLAAGDADRAVEVGGGDRGEHADDEHGGEEADEAVQRGQLEEVEADVDAELRIGPAGGSAVQREQHGLPAGRGRHRGEEADDGGDADHHERGAAAR